MYISKFRVRNFMIHQDTAIEFDPLTVLVGPNGGGKSALFDAMLNFSMLSRGNLRQAFGPYPYSFRATLHRRASTVARIGFEVTMSKDHGDSSSFVYKIDYAQQRMTEDEPIFTIYDEELTSMPDGATLFDRREPDQYALARSLQLEDDRSIFSAIRLASSNGAGETPDPLLEYVTQQISRFSKFRLDPVVLAAPSRMPELDAEKGPAFVPRLGYHGEDLASTLYYLSETNSPALQNIEARIREVVPEFDGFHFNAVGADRVAFSISYSDGRSTVPSVRLSSGMLIFVGLMVLVLTPNRPPVLMIEEPENGLTPQAIRAFYGAAKTLVSKDAAEHSGQVLISSHSPFVICEAWNGEDREFIHQVKVENGRAVIRRFSQVIDDLAIHLGKDAGGQRTHLSLANADQIMSGYLS